MNNIDTLDVHRYMLDRIAERSDLRCHYDVFEWLYTDWRCIDRMTDAGQCAVWGTNGDVTNFFVGRVLDDDTRSLIKSLKELNNKWLFVRIEKRESGFDIVELNV